MASLKWRLFSVLDPFVRKVISYYIHDLALQREWKAAAESASLIDREMAGAPALPSRNELLDAALSRVSVEGMYLEFGVYKGETINFLAGKIGGRAIHGFDSFEGLPESWRDKFAPGKFDLGGRLPPVQSNVTLHAGWFNETLPKFAEEHKGPIAFLHLDCVLYSSTKCVFDIIGDRLQTGSVIVFDEFFNYPDWQLGEYKALQELCALHSLTFEYIGYNPIGEQAAVVIRRSGQGRA